MHEEKNPRFDGHGNTSHDVPLAGLLRNVAKVDRRFH